MAEETPDMVAGLPKSAFARGDDQIRVRTERFRQIYANNLQVGFSSWDLAITFGEIMGEKEGKAVIEETTRILMTREIAKALSRILSAHIAAYEQQFGEIKIPAIEKEPEGETEKGQAETAIHPPEITPAG